MKTQKILLSIDLFFQTILFFGAFAGGVLAAIMGGAGFFILGFPLVLLGIWQVSSGLLMGLLLKDSLRLKYFAGSIFYVLFIFALLDNFEESRGIAYTIFLIITFAIIPLSVGYWYLRLTNHTLIKVNKMLEEMEEEDDMDDILDSGEIFR